MIDWTKPVRTKGDRLPVRILCTDAPGMFPVVGLVGGVLGPKSWDLEGRFDGFSKSHPVDLENVTQRAELADAVEWRNAAQEELRKCQQDAISLQNELAALREVVKALLDQLRLRAVLAPVEKSTIGALEVQIEGDE